MFTVGRREDGKEARYPAWLPRSRRRWFRGCRGRRQWQDRVGVTKASVANQGGTAGRTRPRLWADIVDDDAQGPRSDLFDAIHLCNLFGYRPAKGGGRPHRSLDGGRRGAWRERDGGAGHHGTAPQLQRHVLRRHPGSSFSRDHLLQHELEGGEHRGCRQEQRVVEAADCEEGARDALLRAPLATGRLPGFGGVLRGLADLRQALRQTLLQFVKTSVLGLASQGLELLQLAKAGALDTDSLGLKLLAVLRALHSELGLERQDFLVLRAQLVLRLRLLRLERLEPRLELGELLVMRGAERRELGVACLDPDLAGCQLLTVHLQGGPELLGAGVALAQPLVRNCTPLGLGLELCVQRHLRLFQAARVQLLLHEASAV
mmetsp:Transcript_9076/g.28814  ORF Transcript_9076/g.28814 Transcript_9076/m.28814 type:complete len:375 (+) Transcript_9076:251-1375(+)